MSASFHELRFPTSYDWGSEGTPEFNVSVIELPSGAESRNSFWTTGRKTWKIDKTGMPKTLRLAAESFFRARNGSTFGFRFRDNDWFQVVDEPLPLLTNTTAQLQFVYPDPVNPQIQIVTKPVLVANIQPSSTVDLYSPDITLKRDGSPFTSGGNWTLDRATGIIAYAASQVGHTITWSGAYDWAVRFSSAKSMWKREFIDDYEWTGIELIELVNET